MNTAEKRVVTSLPGASEKIIKTIQKRRSRELVIGLCGAIGSGVKALKNTIVQSLEESGYTVVHIRLRKVRISGEILLG